MELQKTFEQNPEITKEEQKAWWDLSNTLIFTHNNDTPLSVENIKAISEQIQDQFVDLQESRRQQMMAGFFDSLQNMGISDESIDKRTTMLSEHFRSVSPQEFIKQFPAFGNLEAEADGYFGWGFTPRLASLEANELKANCLGRAILLGAYCKKVGIKVEMGVTPDHPLVIATIDSKKYVLGSGGTKEITPFLEEKDGYLLYKVDDKENKPEDEHKNRMAIIHDFDKAVLYETLENFAVLRKLSEKDPQYLLPGSRNEGEKLAQAHKDVLGETDWQTLQNKLFPEVVKSFNENKADWSREIERVRILRGTQYKTRVLSEAFLEALKLTAWRINRFEEALPQIMNLSKSYREDIVSFLMNDKNFGENVPTDIVKFFGSIKQSLDAEDTETRKILYQNIALNLNPKLTEDK